MFALYLSLRSFLGFFLCFCFMLIMHKWMVQEWTIENNRNNLFWYEQEWMKYENTMRWFQTTFCPSPLLLLLPLLSILFPFGFCKIQKFFFGSSFGGQTGAWCTRYGRFECLYKRTFPLAGEMWFHTKNTMNSSYYKFAYTNSIECWMHKKKIYSHSTVNCTNWMREQIWSILFDILPLIQIILLIILSSTFVSTNSLAIPFVFVFFLLCSVFGCLVCV